MVPVRFNKPIRQRGLAVIDVGDDAEISNVCRVHLPKFGGRISVKLP